MVTIQARTALLPDGWHNNVSVQIGDDGRIEKVTTQPPETVPDTNVAFLLPAPVNAHSHAFQHAMAGLTERRGENPQDSFWTWRDLMFRFLDQLNPDHIESITSFVQMKMLEAGYATNVEFHYLHHSPDGTPYAKLSEMADRIIAASARTGIGLTMLPVHYQYGGCDFRPLNKGQRRFHTDLDKFTTLCDEVQNSLTKLPDDTIFGVAPHSLRAVTPDIFADSRRLAGDGPFHMHLAEQIPEVDEVLHYLGARPVEWVLDNMDIDDKCCFIHCTQMQQHETTSLAKSGAIAGLCPITEASLGDGIFDGVNWSKSGGQIAIGSDSNIRISLSEEIRSLEYSQRLRDHSRAALATTSKSTGRYIFEAITAGGAKAAGRKTGQIASGQWADLMALDGDAIEFAGRNGDTVLDSFAIAGDDQLVCDVWSAGRHLVSGGRHHDHDAITTAYRATIMSLKDVI